MTSNAGAYLIKVPELSGDHVFCGQHRISGAVCPNCQLPLIRFFTIQPSDARLQLDRPYHLLFCWRCDLARGPFMYYVGKSDVEILKFRKGPPTLDFPYAAYPDFFPQGPASLERMTGEHQNLIHQLNAGLLDSSQLVVRAGGPGNLHHPRLGAPDNPAFGLSGSS